MKKIDWKIGVIIVLFLSILSVIGATIIYHSDSPVAGKAKRLAKRVITKTALPKLYNETEGLQNIINEISFEDAKKIYETDSSYRFVNYAEGFYFDVSKDFEFHYDRPYITAQSENAKIVVTREWAFDRNVDEYISHYLNRFILSKQYQAENNITLAEHTDNGKIEIITAVINDLDTSDFDKYTYAFIKTNTQNFYRLMFKYNSQDINFEEQIQKTLKTFKYFSPKGAIDIKTDFEPFIPDDWSFETRELYDEIRKDNQLTWGIFTHDIYETGINETVPELEKKLDYKFPVILSYLQFGSEFPTEFMLKNHSDERLVELTYQITLSNNEELFGYTPFLDVYRGNMDEELRRFAREAKKFGHPFLFRLNNESNSDWTSYSGVVNMSDPEIYVEIWRRVYRIFEEEGVDNAIWIFNPNDRNYPPCNWNDFTAYYPGNEYVHMLGITGYNNGTFYKYEKWREFTTIYDEIYAHYMPHFSKFPWIITEFSSSSVGGNKALWIKNMFDNLHKYPEIKIAVWFSYADFKVHNDEEKIVSRPYWLDETEETVNEFKKGLKNYRQ